MVMLLAGESSIREVMAFPKNQNAQCMVSEAPNAVDTAQLAELGGCRCVGAKVNGKMVTIDHTLHNGDIVEIVTSANSSGPSVDWLKIAKSSTARNKIRQWLKRQNKGDDVAKGKEALDKYIRKKGMDPQQVAKSKFLNAAIKELKFNNMDEMYTQIAQGGTTLSRFARYALGE